MPGAYKKRCQRHTHVLCLLWQFAKRRNDKTKNFPGLSNVLCLLSRCDMGFDSNGCWMGNWCQDKSEGGCPAPHYGEKFSKSRNARSNAKGVVQVPTYFHGGENSPYIMARCSLSCDSSMLNFKDRRWLLARMSAPMWKLGMRSYNFHKKISML